MTRRYPEKLFDGIRPKPRDYIEIVDGINTSDIILYLINIIMLLCNKDY